MTQKRDDRDRDKTTGSSSSSSGGSQGFEGGLAEKGGQHAAQTPGSASNLAQYFRGMDFPARKEDLLRHLEQAECPDDLRRSFQNLPEKQYGSMADVMAAWGQQNK